MTDRRTRAELIEENERLMTGLEELQARYERAQERTALVMEEIMACNQHVVALTHKLGELADG